MTSSTCLRGHQAESAVGAQTMRQDTNMLLCRDAESDIARQVWATLPLPKNAVGTTTPGLDHTLFL